MISAADFRKQVSKTLAAHLRTLGFKGSGFNYLMEARDFIFTIGVQASQYGGQCCAEFGIQPKVIESFGNHKIDHKKLKYYQCELRTRLAGNNGADQWWQYSDDPEKNIQIANDIFDTVVRQIIPIVDLFNSNNNILDTIEVSDLDNIFKNIPRKLAGMTPMSSNTRFAWLLTKVHEKKNPGKAKQFARFGLSMLDSTSTFLGKADFENALADNNGT